MRCLRRWRPQLLAGNTDALLRAACARGLAELALLILDTDDAASCFANYDALDVAVASDSADVVARLVNIYENSGACCERLAQALHLAARGGQAGIVRQMLAEGADVNARRRSIGEGQRETDGGAEGEEVESGKTALEAAAEAGHVDVVEILLGAGASATINEMSAFASSGAVRMKQSAHAVDVPMLQALSEKEGAMCF